MKNLCIFAATYILIGGIIRLLVAGFFYDQLQMIRGSVPPCNSIMELLPIRCKSTGKAEPFFYFCPQTKLSVMTYTGKNCLNGKNTPKSNRVTHETGKSTATITLQVSNPYSIVCFKDVIAELQKRFDDEKNAKNMAYCFISLKNLNYEFSEFCKAMIVDKEKE